MAKRNILEIATFGILLILLSEVSADVYFYTRLKFTSITYTEQLKNKTSPEFNTAAIKVQNLIKEALIAYDTRDALNDDSISNVVVQYFSTGVTAAILIAVRDHPEIELAVENATITAVEDGMLGEETVEEESLKTFFKRFECNRGYYLDFDTGNCTACPEGTYQPVLFKGRCDQCPKDTDTFGDANIGENRCRSLCVLDLTYCNMGTCVYEKTKGVTCNCPDSLGVRIGGKRCEPLVTFYVSFNITSLEYSDQLKNKSSEDYRNMSALVKTLVMDTLVASNNNLLTADKFDDFFLLTFEPGLNAALQLNVVNASTIDSALTSALTGAIQSGMIGEETVDSDSLIIINNIVPCAKGSLMDFTARTCVKCPIGTYEPFVDPGQCENCPFGSNTTAAGTSGKFRCLTFCNLNPDYCMNGGTCQFLTSGANLGERCICPFDFSGQRCEKKVTVVQDVYPTYGPEAGGTTITITGVHFDLSRGLTVVIGDSVCTDVIGNETTLICLTGQFNKSIYAFREKMNMTILYASPPEISPVAKGVFTYRRNPRIEEIKPLASFLNGGLILTVMGRYMDGVYEPKLMITISSNDTETVLKNDCTVKSSFMLLCPTPKIENSAISRRKRSAALSRHVRETPVITEAKVGFELDGFTKYHDLSGSLATYSTIAIYPNPEVTRFDPLVRSFNRNESQKLIIKGKNFNHDSILGSFYRVMIGTMDCTGLKIKATELECDVPQKPSNSSNYQVKVAIGNIKFVPGYIKYRYGYWNDDLAKYAIVGSAIGTAALILSAVSAWILVSTARDTKPGKAKDSHAASLVSETTSEDDVESIIPNPMEGYTHEVLPNFSSARFYTSSSRGQGYNQPTGSTTNSQTFMY